MHICDHVELAAMIAAHGRTFIEGANRISATALEQYWTASRSRLDDWSRALKAFNMTRDQKHIRADAWLNVEPVIEEILIGEILVRLWSGMLAENDRRRGVQEAAPVARSIFGGHLEARHRVLSILKQERKSQAIPVTRLNQLRIRVERWTDLIVSNVFDYSTALEFGIDSIRIAEFAEEWYERRSEPTAHHAWELTLASLRTAFRSIRTDEETGPNPNANIASAIIACFPSDLFDATGVMRSLWLVRLSNTTNDAQGLIDELVQLECTSGQPRRAKRF